MSENNFSRSKFNISWISMLVIFVGTIVYPIVYESANKKSHHVSHVLYLHPAPQKLSPDIKPVNTLPAETATPKPAPKAESFKRDLKLGDTGEDVKRLQEYLNARGFVIAESGPGSPGHESELFGKATKEALIKFQEKYADILLKPFGLTEGTGYFGAKTRDFVNS